MILYQEFSKKSTAVLNVYLKVAKEASNTEAIEIIESVLRDHNGQGG
tara:strand:+ start:478 stop:618 length:141 start_codon:yes stop_codon:yes gene_type:complete